MGIFSKENASTTLGAIGSFITGIFGGAKTSPPVSPPTTGSQLGQPKDNTILFMGIGGAVLLVFMVLMMRK